MTALRSSGLVVLLLGACSSLSPKPPPGSPTPLPSGASDPRNYWQERVQGAFACRSRAGLDSFLDRIRSLPPRRPRSIGGGSYQVGGHPPVYDDLYPLDDLYDLYVIWNGKEPDEGIRSLEIVGFPDLQPRIPPEYFEALQAVHRSPSAWNSWSFDPVLLLRAVNTLEALGDGARSALRAYSDLAHTLSFEEQRKYTIDEYRLFPIVQLHSKNPSPFALGNGGVSDPGPATWPLFPMTLEGGVPFLVVQDYTLVGQLEDVRRRLGADFRLRPTPLAPESNPVEAAEALFQSPRWAALLGASDPGNQ
ncbi:MAG TPA: hypothetical protein VG457_14800, partial [Planctomycetota bacterium]|nr:hypothetical protein [Planctomycetota bacterium]